MLKNRSCSAYPVLSAESGLLALFASGPELVEVTARVTELAARAGCVLSEQARLERRYAHAGEPAGVVVLHEQRAIGYAHLVGRAEPTSDWNVELVGDPSQPDAFPAVLAAVLSEAHRAGAPLLRWWAPPSAAMGLLARAFGLECDHVLCRLEAPLRAAISATVPPVRPDGLRLRSLALPYELDAWVSLNRRAFAAHPTQGRWTRADVERRIAQPWFDPQGVLVVEAGGELVATCWVKVQGDALGELYVVAVHPSHQGLGVGRMVAAAGLRHLASRGARTACLYVADHNDPAVRLYRGLGFTPAGSQKVWRAAMAPAR
ncbi:MAG: mycothiol synthase [Actinomycetota bacterium]